jgi:hypothetical protein
LTLDQLDRLLAEVAERHHVDVFVVIGSLTVLARAQDRPIPETMLLSMEVDAWPESDPPRAFEIAREFGLGSSFEQKHGYYFDAVSPALPTFPDGWRDRLIPRKLPSGTLVKFVDPNDAAMAKLARGASKDLQWVRAGLDASLLSIATLAYRFRETIFLDDDEQERVRAVLLTEAGRAGISM